MKQSGGFTSSQFKLKSTELKSLLVGLIIKIFPMEKPLLSNPCSADWNKMQPVEEGRFCKTCCKVVIDFTEKTASEILDFIRARSGERVCGIAKRSELKTIPVTAAQQFSMRLRRFSLALYLVFGGLLFTTASCGGMMEEPSRFDDSIMAAQYAKQDSIRAADSLHTADSAGKK